MDASAEGEENSNSNILTEDEAILRGSFNNWSSSEITINLILDRAIRRSGSGSFLGPEESDDEIQFRGCRSDSNRGERYER